MNVAMLRVPTSIAGDPGDVTVALEVASALWEKGDHEEAIRWLKRAVDAASLVGDDLRGATLRQAVEDLEVALEKPAESVPAASAPSPVSGEVTPADALGRYGRMRVSVKASVRDPSLLLLRPLADGQLPPPGTREGFLVIGDAEVDARAPGTAHDRQP